MGFHASNPPTAYGLLKRSFPLLPVTHPGLSTSSDTARGPSLSVPYPGARSRQRRSSCPARHSLLSGPQRRRGKVSPAGTVLSGPRRDLGAASSDHAAPRQGLPSGRHRDEARGRADVPGGASRHRGGCPLYCSRPAQGRGSTWVPGLETPTQTWASLRLASVFCALHLTSDASPSSRCSPTGHYIWGLLFARDCSRY